MHRWCKMVSFIWNIFIIYDYWMSRFKRQSSEIRSSPKNAFAEYAHTHAMWQMPWLINIQPIFHFVYWFVLMKDFFLLRNAHKHSDSQRRINTKVSRTLPTNIISISHVETINNEEKKLDIALAVPATRQDQKKHIYITILTTIQTVVF